MRVRHPLRPVPRRARALAVLLGLSAFAGSAPALASPEAAPADWRLARADQELAELDALLGTAYFKTALALADATRELLAEAGRSAPVEARRARLEVLAATGELALGQLERARRSLERALLADPGLVLDAAETSPRLVELMRDARSRVEIAGAQP